MALSVKLYRVVGKGKDRRYIPIDLGRRSKEEITGFQNWGVIYSTENLGGANYQAMEVEATHKTSKGFSTLRLRVFTSLPIVRST